MEAIIIELCNTATKVTFIVPSISVMSNDVAAIIAKKYGQGLYVRRLLLNYVMSCNDPQLLLRVS